MITKIGFVVVREGMMDKPLKLVKKLVPKVRQSEAEAIKYSAYTSKKEGNEDKIFWYETYENECYAFLAIFPVVNSK